MAAIKHKKRTKGAPSLRYRGSTADKDLGRTMRLKKLGRSDPGRLDKTV